MKKVKLLFMFVMILTLVLSACAPQAPAEEPMADEPAAEEAMAEEPAAEEPAAEEPMEEPMEEEAMEEETGAIVADEATSTPVVLEEGSAFGEAPMLAEMVAAGDLPPVEERLPVADDIMVVSGVDGIGEYGGTWPLLS